MLFIGTCISPAAIDCGALSTPDKAEKVLETHTRVGGVVRFKCKDKGYKISGSEIRTCLNTGLWSGHTTLCKRKAIHRSVPYYLV